MGPLSLTMLDIYFLCFATQSRWFTTFDFFSSLNPLSCKQLCTCVRRWGGWGVGSGQNRHNQLFHLTCCLYGHFPSHLGDLHTPVEQVLGADIVLVLFDIVQEAAVGHELGDELHGGSQADAEQTTHMRMVDACHHISLLPFTSRDKTVVVSS